MRMSEAKEQNKRSVYNFYRNPLCFSRNARYIINFIEILEV
jgi:hypothetical protein